MTLPKTGDIIKFDRVPLGSYASEGEKYTVTVDGQFVHIRDTETGAGTFDQLWRYNHAIWQKVD